VINLSSNQGLGYQQVRVRFNPNFIAESQLIDYNRLIDTVKELVKRAARSCSVMNPSKHQIEPGLRGRWWVVYQEVQGIDCYWIAISDNGQLIDGFGEGEQIIPNCSILLVSEDSIDSEIAREYSCYNYNGRLDCKTLNLLCCSLFSFCRQLGLDSFCNLMKKKLGDLSLYEDLP
jgi:hypothetical protein